jgi:hypothetical protein
MVDERPAVSWLRICFLADDDDLKKQQKQWLSIFLNRGKPEKEEVIVTIAILFNYSLLISVDV